MAATRRVPLVHAALLGRPLLAWDKEAFVRLRQITRHETLPHEVPDSELVDGSVKWLGYEERDRRRALQVRHDVASGRVLQWRGQLDPKTLDLVPCVPAGTPDRLLYLLRKMAASAAPADQES